MATKQHDHNYIYTHTHTHRHIYTEKKALGGYIHVTCGYFWMVELRGLSIFELSYIFQFFTFFTIEHILTPFRYI